MIDNLNNKFSDTSVISLPYLSSPTGVSATNGDDKMKKLHLQTKNPNISSSNFYGESSVYCGSVTILAYPAEMFEKLPTSRKCKKCITKYLSIKGGK